MDDGAIRTASQSQGVFSAHGPERIGNIEAGSEVGRKCDPPEIIDADDPVPPSAGRPRGGDAAQRGDRQEQR